MMNTRPTNMATLKTILFPLIVGFLFLSFLVFLLFFGTVKRNVLLNQFQFEQEVGRLLSLSRRFNSISEDSLELLNYPDSPIIISAAGLYDRDGQVIFAIGSYPPELAPLNTQQSIFERTSPAGTYTYIRSFNLLSIDFPEPEIGPPMFEGDIPPLLSSDIDHPETIYISGSFRKNTLGVTSLWLLYVVVEVVLAALFYVLGRTYLNNNDYRNQLESQKQLVLLGEAARTLSHEMKNPLSAIGLRLSLLKKRSNSDVSEDILIIQEELERLNELSSRIRDFLKNPVGDPEEIELIEYLNDLLKRMPAGTQFSSHLDAHERAHIKIDKSRLRSVLENIILNAHEADAEGPIEVELEKQRKEVRISILDRGKGIDESIADKIFDPFFTTKTRGSGIGLAISRQITEAAGGSIAYHPRQGGGSEFRVTLPVYN